MEKYACTNSLHTFNMNDKVYWINIFSVSVLKNPVKAMSFRDYAEFYPDYCN
jgi:hypothetical protein